LLLQLAQLITKENGVGTHPATSRQLLLQLAQLITKQNGVGTHPATSRQLLLQLAQLITKQNGVGTYPATSGLLLLPPPKQATASNAKRSSTQSRHLQTPGGGVLPSQAVQAWAGHMCIAKAGTTAYGTRRNVG
jgi:hypothetical protein